MNIEDLKEEVSISEVLTYYGADVGQMATWSTWASIVCPFCSDTNGSGSVNIKRGLYLCHQCGVPNDGSAGDIIDIVKNQDEISTKEAILWLSQTFT